VVVEDQGFVFNDWHRVILADELRETKWAHEAKADARC